MAVEQAPDVIDLNTLLGITDEALEDMDIQVATQTSVDDEEILEPHVTLPTKVVMEVLKISAMVASAGEGTFESSVVAFNIKDGGVQFLLSDNKRNISIPCQVINKDNSFEGFLAFSTSFLARLIRMCGTTFPIIKRASDAGDKYLLKVDGGEIHMDNIKMDADRFIKDFTDPTIKQYRKENVHGSISRLFNFASTAIKSGKNIDFLGKTIQVTPIGGVAKVTIDEELPNFRLSLTDSKILYALLSLEEGDTVGINSDGKVFTGQSFSFKTESYATSPCIFDQVFDRAFASEKAIIDQKHLAQITDLSCGLDTSIGKLSFNYAEDGHVECTLLTKRDDSKLILQGTSTAGVSKLEDPMEVYAANLKGALTVFSTETTLGCRISSDGIALDSGNARVMVLSCSAGK